MIRKVLNETLKQAIAAQDKCAIRTIRLILAALKDRDIGARAVGSDNGVCDSDVYALLRTMVEQRAGVIGRPEEAGHLEVVREERREIDVIRHFIPQRLEGPALDAAVAEAIRTLGARNMKDMGPTMAFLKNTYTDRLDFSEACQKVRQVLAG